MPKNKIHDDLGRLSIIAIVSLILSIIISFEATQNIIFPLQSNKTWAAISDITSNSYNKDWMQFVIFKLSSNILILLSTITMFIFFFKASKFFPKILVSFLLLKVLILTFTFFFQTIIKGPQTPQLVEIISTSFRSFIIPVLWIPYILLSEKCSEIFVN